MSTNTTTPSWTYIRELVPRTPFRSISLMHSPSTSTHSVRKQLPLAHPSPLPHEHRILTQLHPHPNIASPLGYTPRSLSAPEALYTTYCALPLPTRDINTLSHLVDHFFFAARMPEALIWSILIDTLTALVYLRFGIPSIDASTTPVPNWDPVHHNDLHAGNLFIQGHGTDLTREYPRVVIGDFGEADRESEREEMRKMGMEVGVGREGDLYAVKMMMGWLCYEKTRKGVSMLGDRMWYKEYSGELLGVLKGLKGLGEGVEMVGFLKGVKGKYRELMEKGTLKFEPLGMEEEEASGNAEKTEAAVPKAEGDAPKGKEPVPAAKPDVPQDKETGGEPDVPEDEEAIRYVY